MLWDFASQIRKVLFAQSNSFTNVQKKNGLRCQNLFMLQNKESTWCASIFRSKHPRNGYIYIPVCRMFQICANHAKSVPYFLVLKGEIRENWPLSLCKVYCSCASFHYWPPGPQKHLLIYLLQYNSWLKSIWEMTQFRHHPPLIVELLTHQSHFQSTFNAHQSKCMQIVKFYLFPKIKCRTLSVVYVSFIGSRLTKTRLTLINCIRLRTTSGHSQAQIEITFNFSQSPSP